MVRCHKDGQVYWVDQEYQPQPQYIIKGHSQAAQGSIVYYQMSGVKEYI